MARFPNHGADVFPPPECLLNHDQPGSLCRGLRGGVREVRANERREGASLLSMRRASLPALPPVRRHQPAQRPVLLELRPPFASVLLGPDQTGGVAAYPGKLAIPGPARVAHRGRRLVPHSSLRGVLRIPGPPAGRIGWLKRLCQVFGMPSCLASGLRAPGPVRGLNPQGCPRRPRSRLRPIVLPTQPALNRPGQACSSGTISSSSPAPRRQWSMMTTSPSSPRIARPMSSGVSPRGAP